MVYNGTKKWRAGGGPAAGVGGPAQAPRRAAPHRPGYIIIYNII